MPSEGTATINTNPQLLQTSLNDVQYLYKIMIHEFGHILGFEGSSPKEIAIKTYVVDH